jgi:hypothetical protein
VLRRVDLQERLRLRRRIGGRLAATRVGQPASPEDIVTMPTNCRGVKNVMTCRNGAREFIEFLPRFLPTGQVSSERLHQYGKSSLPNQPQNEA